MLKAVADSTDRTYASAWGHWPRFRRLRERQPFLTGGAAEAEDEDDLLTFLIYWTSVLGQAYGTVKTKVHAVRQMHLRAGVKGPLAGKERVWLALRGFKRMSPSTAKKSPVTIEMLRWINQHLSRYDEQGGRGANKVPALGPHYNDTVFKAAVKT